MTDDLNVENEIAKEATGPVGNKKPILCLDFDGVIHDYLNGWQGGNIYGHATKGFFEWASNAQNYFELHIYSSRSVLQMRDMYMWIRTEHNNWLEYCNAANVVGLPWEAFGFIFDKTKPPAFVTIDDRAITFTGRWDDPSMLPQVLRSFKPWNANEPHKASSFSDAPSVVSDVSKTS